MAKRRGSRHREQGTAQAGPLARWPLSGLRARLGGLGALGGVESDSE